MFKVWIEKRGLVYLEYASDIWKKRKRKLIDRWCSLREKDKTFEEFEYFQRLQQLSFKLDDTMRALENAYFEEKAKQREDRHRLDYTMLVLHCQYCQFKIMRTSDAQRLHCHTVLFKDYIPGEILCKECGNPLTTFEEEAMQHELRKMRIRI